MACYLPSNEYCQNYSAMIINYMKIAIRVFGRNKLISIINLLGLSIGIAVFVISIFYVGYEFNFEDFQPNHSRIYRICSDKEFVGSPLPIAKIISNGYPEVESVTRIGRSSWSEKVVVKAENRFFYENRFYVVDSNFFQTFDYPLIYGNSKDVLSKPYAVVLSEKIAKKYFNRINVVGETIEFNDHTYIISGVAKDVPPSSHFHFDLLTPFRGTIVNKDTDLNRYWGSVNYFTYVKLKEKISAKELQNKLVQNATEEYKEYVGADYFKELYFQPIRQAHTEVIRGNLEAPVNKKYLMIYVFVAIIILLVASINFINLSIAGSLKRAKEIGLRKVVGAERSKIRNQFLSESILFTFIGLALSFVFIESFIPLLNQWFDISIQIDYFDKRFLLLNLIILVWVGIISGSYPAFVVSRIQPIKVLKSGFRGNKANTTFRNILMVLQFIISISLIISAILINMQMNYIDKKDIGFNRQNVINIPLHDNGLKTQYKYIKQAFSSNSNIINVSANSFNIGDRPFHQTVIYEKGSELAWDMAWFILTDRDFFNTFKINVLLGTTFPIDYDLTPTKGYVINKCAAKAYFGDENPIGKRLSMRGEKNMGQVVGVIDDFNFRSLHYPIEPLVFSLDSEYDYISLRVNPGEENTGLKFIENKWKELYPNYPFEIKYIENEYEMLYSAELKTGSLILVFTILSILISCMGLFGINSLITKYRIREISVRKAFGASLPRILWILSTNISKLVLIGSLIAWPLAFYMMDNWLDNFMYRIQIPWFVFILSGIITWLIALVTVSAQSLKTANTNPAETLKFE